MHRWLLSLALLSASCAQGTTETGADAPTGADGTTGNDAPATIDARPIDARPPDARPPDAFVPPDVMLPPDSFVPPDSFQPPDATPPQDIGPVAGLTCLAILTADPSATDGPYVVDPGTGPVQAYCDMTHGGYTYEQLAQGAHDSTYTGYSQVSVSDLNDPVIRQAYIWLYNHQSSSIINIDMTFTTGNCCIQAADTNGGKMLALGPDQYVYPASTLGFSDCNSQYLAAAYRFYIPIPNVYSPAPMPTNFFDLYPPGSVTNCTDDNNPAWFFKKYL